MNSKQRNIVKMLHLATIRCEAENISTVVGESPAQQHRRVLDAVHHREYWERQFDVHVQPYTRAHRMDVKYAVDVQDAINTVVRQWKQSRLSAATIVCNGQVIGQARNVQVMRCP